MRVVLLADTHELHREVDLPSADLLIHAGDWTMFSGRPSAISDFNTWLSEQNLRHGAVIVPGNHDSYLQSDPNLKCLTSQAILLNGQGCDVAGLKIWGSPITPLANAAFGQPDAPRRAAHWNTIPVHIDILVTHGPPYGILDGPPGTEIHEGDPALLAAVRRVRPKLHVFGHVHAGYGVLVREGTTFVNAALLGENGDIEHKPLVFDFKER